MFERLAFQLKSPPPDSASLHAGYWAPLFVGRGAKGVESVRRDVPHQGLVVVGGDSTGLEVGLHCPSCASCSLLE